MENLMLKASGLGITNVLTREQMKKALGGIFGTRCPSGCTVTTTVGGHTTTKSATCALNTVTNSQGQQLNYCDCSGTGDSMSTCSNPVTDPS